MPARLSSSSYPSPVRLGLAFAALLAAPLVIAPRAAAQDRIVLPVEGTAAAQFNGRQLKDALRAKLPNGGSEQIDHAASQFMSHLRESHPIAADELAANRMNPDDLSSELDIFLEEHPELTGARQAVATASPRTRVAEALKAYSDLARSDAERLSLADRFMQSLSGSAGLAYQSLQDGHMSDDELQSRVAVFAGDLRAAKTRVEEDPAVAAAGPIIAAYEKANFGDVAQRPDSVSYRGEVDQGSVKRQFVMFEQRPNKVRIDIVQNGLVVGILAFDGSSAWREGIGRAPIKATGMEARALAETSQTDDPFLGYQDRGAVARVVERPADGPVRIDLKERNGAEMEMLIDPKTYEATARRYRQADGNWDEIKLSDYHRTGSLNVPYTQEHWSGGQLRSTTHLSAVAINPGLIARFFTMPTNAALGYMDYMGGLAVLASHARPAQPANPAKISFPGSHP